MAVVSREDGRLAPWTAHMPSDSWWISADFYRRAQAEQARMRQSFYGHVEMLVRGAYGTQNRRDGVRREEGA